MNPSSDDCITHVSVMEKKKRKCRWTRRRADLWKSKSGDESISSIHKSGRNSFQSIDEVQVMIGVDIVRQFMTRDHVVEIHPSTNQNIRRGQFAAKEKRMEVFPKHLSEISNVVEDRSVGVEGDSS